MAGLTVNQLPNADLPILGTDILLITRDGVIVKQVTSDKLPVSEAVQTAVDTKEPKIQGSRQLTANTATLATDRIITNSTGNNYILTIDPGTIEKLDVQQMGDGTITLAPGTGVTLSGQAIATFGIYQELQIRKTAVPNKYLVRLVGGSMIWNQAPAGTQWDNGQTIWDSGATSWS